MACVLCRSLLPLLQFFLYHITVRSVVFNYTFSKIRTPFVSYTEIQSQQTAPSTAMVINSPYTNMVYLLIPAQAAKGLVTNYGEGRGLQNERRGRQVKFHPYKKKGGGRKVLAMLKGGGGGKRGAQQVLR